MLHVYLLYLLLIILILIIIIILVKRKFSNFLCMTSSFSQLIILNLKLKLRNIVIALIAGL